MWSGFRVSTMLRKGCTRYLKTLCTLILNDYNNNYDDTGLNRATPQGSSLKGRLFNLIVLAALGTVCTCSLTVYVYFLIYFNTLFVIFTTLTACLLGLHVLFYCTALSLQHAANTIVVHLFNDYALLGHTGCCTNFNFDAPYVARVFTSTSCQYGIRCSICLEICTITARKEEAPTTRWYAALVVKYTATRRRAH